MGFSNEYSQTTQEIINKVNCPYQVLSKGSTVEEANEIYKAAVKRGKTEGFVPVFVVSDDVLAEWLGVLEDDSYSKEKILSQPQQDTEAILQKYYKEYLEDYDDEAIQELMGEKECGEQILELSSFMSYDGSGIQETILFEIPVKNPWEVIAWLPMGGWNECPEASEMMEVCRYWHEQYGAVVAAVSHDTLELVVEKPVSDEEQAWKLAKEHYAFCPDRVDQGTETGTIGEVADCISMSTVWFFWWD